VEGTLDVLATVTRRSAVAFWMAPKASETCTATLQLPRDRFTTGVQAKLDVVGVPQSGGRPE
jgi:hypothetical protein